MTGFSRASSAAFSGLKPRQIFNLTRIINSCELLDRNNVKRIFEKENQYFYASLKLIEVLGYVNTEVFGVIKTRASFRELVGCAENRSSFYKFLILKISESTSSYNEELVDYLKRMESSLVENKFLIDPLPSRSELFHVRDFLIEAGALLLNLESGVCQLSKEFDFLRELVQIRHSLTPDELKLKLEEKEKLGLKAELEVLELERASAGDYCNLVTQVSAHDVAAGYDIRSVRTSVDGRPYPIYIEVKAVRKDDSRFFWTHNERVCATRFTNKYFLYLVPVFAGKPSVDQIEVVQNPIVNIFAPESLWDITEATLELRKK